MSFVLDNSITMCWLLKDGSTAGIAYSDRVLSAMAVETARVPAIWGLEVANVVARIESRGLAPEARTQAFISLLQRMDIVPDHATAAHALGETLNLARRYRLSAYDAAYLELALREALPLATLDADLRQAADKAGVKVFEFGG